MINKALQGKVAVLKLVEVPSEFLIFGRSLPSYEGDDFRSVFLGCHDAVGIRVILQIIAMRALASVAMPLLRLLHVIIKFALCETSLFT